MQVLTPFSFVQTDAAMIPFDTTKLLFQPEPTLNGGSFLDTHPRPFHIKNTSGKDLLITWANATFVCNFGIYSRQNPGTILGTGLTNLDTAGVFIPKNQSVFSDFTLVNFGTTSISVTYVGTMTLTEVCGWAFDSVSGFDTLPANFASAPPNLADGVSFKMQPNVACPLNFFYNESD
jgi:hypothetical protein